MKETWGVVQLVARLGGIKEALMRKCQGVPESATFNGQAYGDLLRFRLG